MFSFWEYWNTLRIVPILTSCFTPLRAFPVDTPQDPDDYRMEPCLEQGATEHLLMSSYPVFGPRHASLLNLCFSWLIWCWGGPSCWVTFLSLRHYISRVDIFFWLDTKWQTLPGLGGGDFFPLQVVWDFRLPLMGFKKKNQTDSYFPFIISVRVKCLFNVTTYGDHGYCTDFLDF